MGNKSQFFFSKKFNRKYNHDDHFPTNFSPKINFFKRIHSCIVRLNTYFVWFPQAGITAVKINTTTIDLPSTTCLIRYDHEWGIYHPNNLPKFSDLDLLMTGLTEVSCFMSKLSNCVFEAAGVCCKIAFLITIC